MCPKVWCPLVLDDVDLARSRDVECKACWAELAVRPESYEKQSFILLNDSVTAGSVVN